MQGVIWLAWSFLTLVMYSLWGVFNGAAARHLDSFNALFFSSIGYFLVGLLSCFIIGHQTVTTILHLSPKGMLYGILLGFTTGLGGLFLLIALHKGGNINIIIPLTAMYPLFAVLINLVLFHTHLDFKQIIGIALSVLAIVLLTV